MGLSIKKLGAGITGLASGATFSKWLGSDWMDSANDRLWGLREPTKDDAPSESAYSLGLT